MKNLMLIAGTAILCPVFAHAQSGSAATARGKLLYEKHCASCHMNNGEGVPELNPPLSKTVYVFADNARLIRIILYGITEPLTINNSTYTNPMPPAAFLKDAEVADILTYVRNSFGNKAASINAAEVKSIRSAGKK
jgi:mono/diheme cytochrome c family protein